MAPWSAGIRTRMSAKREKISACGALRTRMSTLPASALHMTEQDVNDDEDDDR